MAADAVSRFPEDDDPEQFIGEDLEDVDADEIDPAARYTLAEWESLRQWRGDA